MMEFYRGKTVDGTDAEKIEGIAYINPNNPNEWSSEPYPAQKKELRLAKRLRNYMNGRDSLNMFYRQIKEKSCKLPYSLRVYVLSFYDSEDSFIDRNDNR